VKLPAYEVGLTFEARQGIGRWLTYHTATLDEARMLWSLIRQATHPEWVRGHISTGGQVVEQLDSIEADQLSG
jgi:hypothetical protein